MQKKGLMVIIYQIDQCERVSSISNYEISPIINLVIMRLSIVKIMFQIYIFDRTYN